MQFNVRMMVTLGCVSLLATSVGMSLPAYGAPKSKEPKAKSAIQRAADAKSKIRAARNDRNPRLVSMPVAQQDKRPVFGWPVLVSEARKYMGTNPTDRKRLWCATFMNMVLRKAGYSGTNSDAAKSFAQYGRRISEPKVGAIAVLTRGKNGGHVGVVSGIDANGNPIIISGNHNKRVGEATYARARVIAYVMPSEYRGNTQVASGPASKPLDLGIDSPISELIAAIEAESAPVRLPPGANANARQVPEPAAQQRRKIELDPAIASFLGIKPQSQTAQRVAPPQVQPQQVQPRVQPLPAPQRELRVEQQASGRLADAGLIRNISLPLSR